MGFGQSKEEKLSLFKYKLETEIVSKLDTELKQYIQTSGVQKAYDRKFFNDARSFFVSNQDQVSQQVHQDIEHFGSLQNLLNFYTLRRFSEITFTLDKEFKDLAKEWMGALDEEEVWNQVLNTEALESEDWANAFEPNANRRSNKKFKDFKIDDVLIPKVIQAYVYKMAYKDEVGAHIQNMFNLHMNQLLEQMPIDVKRLMTEGLLKPEDRDPLPALNNLHQLQGQSLNLQLLNSAGVVQQSSPQALQFLLLVQPSQQTGMIQNLQSLQFQQPMPIYQQLW